MGIKKQALLLVISLSILGCSTQTIARTKEESDFRKYAMSICIGSSFSVKSISSDANTSANSYHGNVDLIAYDKLRDLQKTWKVDGFKSKNGGKVNIARCIEFSESREVGLIFEQFNPCRNKESWLDADEYSIQCS